MGVQGTTIASANCSTMISFIARCSQAPRIRCGARNSSKVSSLIRAFRFAITLPLAPLLAQLRPIVEPLPDLALEAAFGRIVEGLPPERFGEIVLAGEAFRRVMVVFVA